MRENQFSARKTTSTRLTFGIRRTKKNFYRRISTTQDFISSLSACLLFKLKTLHEKYYSIILYCTLTLNFSRKTKFVFFTLPNFLIFNISDFSSNVNYMSWVEFSIIVSQLQYSNKNKAENM